MKIYYKERAPVYDQVYAYPEREKDLAFLQEYIPSRFGNLSVLEVAAGTGYWTQFIAQQAKSILATDLLEEPLLELKKRNLPDLVATIQADAYKLYELSGPFDGAFVGLWLSHVPKQKVGEFLQGLHQLLPSGAAVVLLDNSQSQCIRLPITREDELGNTYQERALESGSVHEVLKNFPSEIELRNYLDGFASDIQYRELEHFWLMEYRVL